MRLPSRPSALIRLALQDLRRVEADPRYEIDMSDWHVPDSDSGTCAVCLAGAVMAGTLRAPPEDSRIPGYYSYHNEDQLYRLNTLRKGQYFNGLHDIEFPVPSYRDDPAGFHVQMEAFAQHLRERGL